MSKKRKSPESSNEEQTLEGSDSVFQPEDNTKRAKLVSLSDTTLQDLPVELIECILVKAVAMEVKAMKLAKRLWKEKAALVISRLRTVSLQWNNILTTNFFRNELHRILDGSAAQETIRWEILIQPSIQLGLTVRTMTSMRDEVLMLWDVQGHADCYVLRVYDRANLLEPKDVIPLSKIHPINMVTCRVSNCVYLLNADGRGPSVIRITKDEHQFKTSVWIKHLRLPTSDMGPMSASANGNLIIFSRQRSPQPTVVGIYDANGFVQYEIRLSPASYGFIHVTSVIQKSNGNLLLICSDYVSDTKLWEIATSGRIIRKYQSSYRGAGVKSFEDINGRILVNCLGTQIELLDTELNLLDVAVPRRDDGKMLSPYQMHYNSERHELMGFSYDWVTMKRQLVVIRFTEE